MNQEKRLSVTEAKEYIEKNYGEAKLPLNGGVLANLFVALKSGALIAKGIYQPDIFTSSKVPQTIPIDYWRGQHLLTFNSPLQLPNKPFYKDTSILATDIDRWLTPNRVSNAPKPLTPARGVYVPRKEYYSVPIKENDYIRCITDGVIKVHCLAALACDLSPPENTGDGSAISKLYTTDFLNSERPLGLICNKLVQAIQTKKLPIISTGYSAGCQWLLISLSEGVQWLQKQPGITVSERLKKYIVEHLNIDKPTPLRLEIFNSETHWNVVQSLSWIMFRDPLLVERASSANENFGTHWEEHNLPSGKQLVEITNRRMGLMSLTLEAALEPDKTVISFIDACALLINCLRGDKFQTEGIKNNVGDNAVMNSKDWKNTDFYEDKYDKIYVARRDHITEIGRTLWYDVTFKKADIMKEWPLPDANQDAVRGDMQIYAGGVTWVDEQYDERLGEAIKSKTKTKSPQKPKPFKGKPGAKTKYPDDVYIEMRELITSKSVDSITNAAKKVAPKYKTHSEAATIQRLTQTYNKRIAELAD